MKTFILSVLMLMVVSMAHGQLAVRTEDASNIYKFHSALTTGDTMIIVGTTTYKGAVVRGLYLIGIAFGQPIASDTTIIMNGLGTAAYIVQTSTVTPYFYPLGFRTDTSLVFIQKKATRSTLPE